jgi:RHS repeat-associated protein
LLNWTNPKTGLLSNNVYDEKGRITQNDQLGKVNFNTPGKLYQASSIEPNANLVKNWPDKESILQKITYNENNDPIYLDGKNGDYAFEYGLNESRQVMYYGGNFDPALASQQAKFAKYYSEDGSYEVVLDKTTGQEKHVLYIGGTPYESNIVLLKNFTEQTAKFVFLHKDYLGTVLAITNDTGAVLEQRHFDAWGVLTHGEMKVLDRGYTSHEHLQDVGIIHMNGRLYDPLLRRFLNADENIQDPYNTQNYNKYGYVMNNPLLFNDPSGELIPLLVAWLGSELLAAVFIGAAVGLASYTIGLAVTGNLWRWSVSGALTSMFWGGVSGAITFGIGSMFSTVGANGAAIATKFGESLGGLGSGGMIFTAGACHAVAQGALSMMQGGKFWSGAAAGFLGHLGAEGWSAAAGNFAKNAGGIVAFGALSGGIGAELTGGNFWEGAVTGGIVSGLNHAMHQGDNYEDVDQEDPPANKPPTGKPSIGDLKKSPPNHPDYKAPKSGPRSVKHPRGKGWVDRDGRTWIPDDHGGTHAPHWDVQPKKGPGYETKYPMSLTPQNVAVGVGAVTAGYVLYKVGVAILTWECFGCGVLVTP